MRRGMHIRTAGAGGRRAFTLLELLLAVAILAVVGSVTFVTFSAATIAWRRGMAMTDRIHHADFVIEQFVAAMRSAYYPDSGVDSTYGMWFRDNGDGAHAADMVSWVKIGHALVGRDASYAGGPHRVKIEMDKNDGGEDVIAIRAWGLLSQVEDFDPEELEPMIMAMKVTGLNYRFQDPEQDDEDQTEIEWIDEWEETNRIPLAVEMTVYMEALDEGEDAVEIKRIVELPLGPLAWPGRKTP